MACEERHSSSVSLREGIAELIDRAAADRARHKLEGVSAAFGDGFQHAFGLADDFGADPVSGKQDDFGVHGVEDGKRSRG